ncbi:hypothetical protein T484DRAFT_3201318 [Baffinella frigidus]|nr:hypothetical protein T484DRAFT_3201318 [Cryptophyta sp. CCMP2293]
MGRYSTEQLYDTAAICPKEDAMPNDSLSFFDQYGWFTNMIWEGEALREACSLDDISRKVFPNRRIGSAGSADMTECQTCMDRCPGGSNYVGSDAQKTCIANCLLPYATCSISVKVGLSGRGPWEWADAPVGYSSVNTNTKLGCAASLSVSTDPSTTSPGAGFFQLQPARTEDYGSVFKWSRLMPTRTSEAFTMSMRTSAVAWEGTCRLGMCHVCAEGVERCSSGRGIPQVCQHGRWVESKIGVVVQELDEPFGWNEDLIVQTALTVFAGVMMVLLCALTAMGCVKHMSPASQGSHMKYAPPPNTVQSHLIFPCCTLEHGKPESKLDPHDVHS